MTVTTHIADGLGLLERYVPGRGTLLASPNRTVLTQDVIAVVPAGAQGDELADLPQRARASLEDSSGDIDVAALVRNLATRDPRAQVFAVDISDSSPGPRTLVGASPELLVRRRGQEVSTLPLAGSAARSDDPIEDALRAAALLGSEKDRQEHAILVESVAAALRPLCDVLEVPAGPELMRTGAMWHLASPIRGRLAHRDTCSLTLVAALHPTPAVCGQPVAASDPRAELAETTAKTQTMLDAMGLT